MELWQRLGDLHPKLVQFPLVLLLSGLVFDAIGLVRRDRRFHWAAPLLSGGGTVLLLLAFICGIYAEIWAGRAGVPQDPIEWHEFLANVASWGFVILMAWRMLINRCTAVSNCSASTPPSASCFYVLLGDDRVLRRAAGVQLRRGRYRRAGPTPCCRCTTSTRSPPDRPMRT